MAMAAPTVASGKKAACLVKPTQKSNKKTKSKNILCGEREKWPRASEEVEDAILLKLSETLKNLPNIFKHVTTSSKEDLEAKRKVRVQLDLGTNCVCRSLEKDRLAGVLVSSKMTPASALDHVVAIARERGCPLLCLDALSTTLAKVTKSKAFPLCIGFKRLIDCGRADFIDVLSLIKENTTVHRNPAALKNIQALKEGKKKRGQRAPLPESMRPVSLDASTDEAVRNDLKRIFSDASVQASEAKMATNKERKRKKNKMKKATLKQYYRQYLHHQFETGKSTVAEFVGSGRIRVVLVIPELLPVLMSEHPSTSLLCVAKDQDCPVLCVSNLSKVLCVNVPKALAVLGIKKESYLPMQAKAVFSPVIEKCINFMRSASMPEQEMDMEETGKLAGEVSTESKAKKDGNNVLDEDYSFLYVSKKDSEEFRQKALKLREEREKTSKQMAFGDNFISFSGADSADTDSTASVLGKRKSTKPLIAAGRLKPKKMLMDKTDKVDGKSTKLPQADVSDNPFGFISFGGSAKEKQDATAENTEMVSDAGSALFSISREGDGKKPAVTVTEMEEDSMLQKPSSEVLGLDSVESAAKTGGEGVHVSNVFSATERKGKGENKKRHGQEGFVAFNYTEANIHTMVTNSDRKKRNKK